MSSSPAIRAALVAALMGNTDAENQVFNSRDTDFGEDELPAINVSTDPEVTDLLCTTPRCFRNTLPITIKIDCISSGEASDAQAEADAIASNVGEILEGSNLSGLLVELTQLESQPGTVTKGETYGSTILKFEATYYS